MNNNSLILINNRSNNTGSNLSIRKNYLDQQCFNFRENKNKIREINNEIITTIEKETINEKKEIENAIKKLEDKVEKLLDKDIMKKKKKK